MPEVIALVDDIMFLSRIHEAARGAGLGVRQVRRAAELGSALREGGRLVLVDADSDRLPWAEALGAVREEPSRPRALVVAFLSHVRAERAAAAREAGCDRTLARSAFARELPGLMAAAVGAESRREGHAS
jgi:CheY-like chemotaxis protein